MSWQDRHDGTDDPDADQTVPPTIRGIRLGWGDRHLLTQKDPRAAAAGPPRLFLADSKLPGDSVSVVGVGTPEVCHHLLLQVLGDVLEGVDDVRDQPALLLGSE